MVPDTFIEYYYGKYQQVDLHGMTKEEARASLIHALNSIDFDIKCLVVVHGYHGGTVLKNLVKKEFSHPSVAEKITLDAARTIFVIKNTN